MKRGITLIELLLVIAIIAIIGVVTTPLASGFLIRNYLRNTTNEIDSALKTAQNNSLSGKQDSQWGVEISASTIKMYALGNSAFNQIYNIPFSISVTQDTIVFDQLTGNPDATAEINVSSNADTNTINVNQVGAINVN